MENASKAIIMGGSILITLIIISLVVLLFNQLSNIKREEDTSLTAEQVEKYNRQFEIYNRSLYGSELLSIANLIEDYENKPEYEEINQIIVEVEFEEGCKQVETLKANTVYTIQEVQAVYKAVSESDLTTFKRLAFECDTNKTKYTSSGRISYLKFIGKSLTDEEWELMKKALHI